MNKLSTKDMNILKVLDKLGVRFKNPCNIWPVVDSARINYNMSNNETYDTLKHLEEIGYIETNGAYISMTEQQDNKIYSQNAETINGREYTIEQRKAARFKMLEKIYSEVGGFENSYFDIYQIGETLNFSTDLTIATAEYLKNEGLIEYKALNGVAGITHYGIVQYEQALRKPEQESRHFLPVSIIQNILKADRIDNIQIQQGNYKSKQEMNKNNEFANLLLWLQKLEDSLIEENKIDILEELKVDIKFIKDNIASENPNTKYIKIALDTIKGKLTKLATSAIFQWLLQTLSTLMP